MNITLYFIGLMSICSIFLVIEAIQDLFIPKVPQGPKIIYSNSYLDITSTGGFTDLKTGVKSPIRYTSFLNITKAQEVADLLKEPKLKTVYLASPYSHEDEIIMMGREYDVTNAAAKLMDRHRVSFFLPITQSAAMKRLNPKLGTSFEAWKDIDLNEIRIRDELWVLMLDDWDKSIGVLAEIEYAKELGKPIKYIYPKSLRFKKDKKDKTKKVNR